MDSVIKFRKWNLVGCKHPWAHRRPGAAPDSQGSGRKDELGHAGRRERFKIQHLDDMNSALHEQIHVHGMDGAGMNSNAIVSEPPAITFRALSQHAAPRLIPRALQVIDELLRLVPVERPAGAEEDHFACSRLDSGPLGSSLQAVCIHDEVGGSTSSPSLAATSSWTPRRKMGSIMST